ncbi:MAG: potassium transporter KefB [candidate division Zixibacteria bacterium]|nr:potassium transporter KefB [candidate division Zixibacteria bacterium]
MEISLLKNITIIFSLSIIILIAFQKMKIPAVIGFFLSGILVGPFGFGLISDVHQVEILSEIGVILLLFTIGTEFSLAKLMRIKRVVLLGGFLQMLLTSALVTLVLAQLGTRFNVALFIGFNIALSSTAIVLRTLQERSEIDTPHGRSALGILIFQDLAIVPIILLTPLLAGTSAHVTESMSVLLLKGVVVVGMVFVIARWALSWVLYHITKTRSQEIFIMSVALICFGIAWLTYEVGLSLALGAFLAGLVISETEYNHAALGNILPFRNVFITFFFISIGMMLDLHYLQQQVGMIILVTLLVLVVKGLIAGAVVLILGLPLRTGILAGFALCQIGEFSFILSRIGMEHDLLTSDNNQLLLAVAIISMAATPLLISLSHAIAGYISKLPFTAKLQTGYKKESEYPVERKENHLIIIGYGTTGRIAARGAKNMGIPYIIIEMNPETVKREKGRGEPIFYGDASQEIILEHAFIKDAHTVLVGINDPAAAERITEAVRSLNENAFLIIRTRYLHEITPLHKLGADEVVPEEFESSIEIVDRILSRHQIPQPEIANLTSRLRANGYKLFRRLSDKSNNA